MRALLAIALLIATTWATPALAYVYFTPDQLVAAYFPDAEHVDTVRFVPDAAQRAALKERLGYALPKDGYDILVGRRGEDVLGYAIVDDQLGQHDPITFGVLLDASAHVRRVEIMVYREAYGDGVRAPGFRDQFTGLGAEAPMRVGKEIRIVSGATISSRAIATGTRRACAIVEAWLGRST